jgi:antibiotic biosynthesis monooxygenase (ABM) superfamily enzyme
VHQRIRNLDRDNHAEAVLLAKTDTTFDKFLEQNQQRIDGLKKDFDRNAKSLSTNMSSFAKVSWLYFFITSALIILGLRPRIREFF